MLVDLGLTLSSGAILLAQDPAPAPGQGPEFGQASPIALLVVVVLGLALVVLIRSMTKHLGKVPATFDHPEDPPPTPPSAEEPKD